jgi:HD-GYP domain-containing protein (c-di-GMP phosphodiesterase class II)
MQTVRPPSPGSPQLKLRLSDVLAALTIAFDLTEGLVPGHAARTCYLAMRIGQELGFSDDLLSDLFYAALLKDAGCSSNAARVCQIYGADDRLLKHDYEHIDSSSLLACARYVLEHAGPNDPWTRRLARLATLAVWGRSLQREVETTRCERGAAIARELGFGDAVAASVYSVGECWDGKGQPAGLRREEIPLLARVVGVAQTIDVFAAGSPSTALDVIAARRGRALDPEIVDAFTALEAREGEALWHQLANEDRSTLIGRLEPAGREVVADNDRLDQVAIAFAEVIDAKSPFTGNHSYNVALVAEAMIRRLGLTEADCRVVRWASLVHDIGELSVSNVILDKTGALAASEWDVMRNHPRHTLDIVGRIPAFQGVAQLASLHHERIDGAGYFRGLRGEQLSLSARVIAVADVWDALINDRPYRPALPVDQALSLLDGMAGWHLGREAFEALQDVF